MTGGFRYWRAAPAQVADARFDETLIEVATQSGPVACLWEAPQSLVVPRSYRRFPAFNAASEQYQDMGWPVMVRQTGGGIVPQGPGILNLSLSYTVKGPPMSHSEAGYRLICDLVGGALGTMGIDAFPAAVEGSFCDGRYNLAVAGPDGPIKVAGTAQLWRRVPGSGDLHVGLVHALLLLNVDIGHVTHLINAFEAAIGSERRYRHDRAVSVADVLTSCRQTQADPCECRPGATELANRYAAALQNVLRTEPDWLTR